MPIFEFSCSDCGQDFEELLRSTDAGSQVTCPRCGGVQVKKKISSFASRITGGTSGLSASSAPACSPGGT
ncbi:MAG: zinc ribbon domain-containing protein [Chloroflexota bacterium]